MNTISANDFEKRAILGFAPVYPDGSLRIRVPADLPISFATLDSQGRGFVVKRTHLICSVPYALEGLVRHDLQVRVTLAAGHLARSKKCLTDVGHRRDR